MMGKWVRALGTLLGTVLIVLQNSSSTTGKISAYGGERQLPFSQNVCLPSELNPSTDLPSHIKYLSMVGGEFEIDAPYNAEWIADTQKLAQFGNVITLGLTQSSPAELQDLEKKLSYVKTLQKNAVVHIQNVFVDRERTALHGDYEENWYRTLPILEKYRDVVIALYLWDEPFWAAKSNNVSPTSVYESLILQNRLVKKTLPGIPTAIVEGYPVVNDSLRIPPGIDWVGMDCYEDFQSCGDERYAEKRSIPEYYEILKSKMTAHQKLITVPTGIGNYTSGQVPLNTKLNIVETADDFFEWASTQERMVGLFTFIYHSTDAYAAADSMCEVEEYYRKAGEKFLAAEANVPPVPTPLSVSLTAQTAEGDYALETSPSVQITSDSDVKLMFAVSGGAADLYGVQCDMTDPTGTIVDCAGHLDSGLTIPAYRAGTYEIKISRSTETVITHFSIASGTSAE